LIEAAGGTVEAEIPTMNKLSEHIRVSFFLCNLENFSQNLHSFENFNPIISVRQDIYNCAERSGRHRVFAFVRQEDP
jgi:hypothetical protein